MTDTSTDFPLRSRKHGVDIDLNSQDFVEGSQKEAQKIVNALSINTAELDWNHFIGINQQDLIMNSHNERALDAMIQHYLKRMFGNDIASANVTDLTFDNDTRTANFKIKVVLNTQDGPETVTAPFRLNGGD